jgi:hypothetical protein
MPVVIQQLETGLFWGQNGAWVKEQSEAKDFERSGAAIVHCVTERLMDVRVGMLFGDPEMDVYYYPFKAKNNALAQEGRQRAHPLRRKKGNAKRAGSAVKFHHQRRENSCKKGLVKNFTIMQVSARFGRK